MLIFLGFAGNGFKKDAQVLLKPGEQATIGSYTIRNDGLKVSDDGQKQATTAYLAVFEGGKQIDTLYPAKWAFRNHENEPTTEVAIRRTFAEDLYIVLAFQPSDLATQTATLQITVNPLVNWIWFGFGIMALGTGIALLPERAYSFAVAKLPVEAAATTTALSMLLAMLVFGGSTLSAQKGMGGPADQNIQSSYYARNEFEKKMQHEIVCTCGACGHATIAECRKDPCMTSHEMRERPGRAHRSGQEPRRDHPGVHHQARQPGDARRADRQGLQPARVAVPVSGRRHERSGHRVRGGEVDAEARRGDRGRTARRGARGAHRR